MNSFSLAIAVLLFSSAYFFLGTRASTTQRASGSRLHSLPHYYGLFAGLVAAIPALLLLAVLAIGDDIIFRSMALDFVPDEVKAGDNYKEVIVLAQITNVVNGINFGEQPQWVHDAADAWRGWDATSTTLKTITTLSLSLLAGLFAYRQINPGFRSRNAVERILMIVLAGSSAIAIFTTIGIVFSVVFESMRFFALVPVSEFLFGLTWNPQFEGAERAGSGQQGLATYGSVPLFVGTFLISVVALSVAVPVGLFSAIYLSEYASPRVRAVVKPLMELLAGVPTVVYGFFAALTVAPFIRGMGMNLGLDVASESALAAGLVMGIMIIPFVSSLSDDVINAVPQALRDAAYGLGSTQSETVRQVVLPAALPGVVAAILLAVSRAVGETMIVVMAAGLAANLSLNPLDAVTTVTSQIVTILVGDQEFESAKTLSAFALALTLIVITLVLNFMALQIVKKYREQYD
ncbi:MAG: phosphate ABC transporter permease subunit PstC [SAR116 cluster bacterium]|nr:phosphate ABC transporter permease subunit PstC [SAR116 cluster bacterium]RPG99604.1 MAG: phosphate ABC transporter permease subunit PstC [Candidatus Puniceispirillum sp. TMED176]